MAMWLEVELLATEGQARSGVVPPGAAAACRQRAPRVDAEMVAAVNERERVTDHDVAAFVDVVQDRIGAPEGSWIHFGLTSSDVVDTALCATLVRAADLLLAAADDLVEALRDRAVELDGAPVTGRTHGMHAEATTFGAKFALWALQADRDRQRLRNARERVAVGKLSGAVGTYSNIDPEVEAFVCGSLGLVPVPATQVIARDRHAEYLWACAAVGATVETDRYRDPPPGPERGRRGRGGLRCRAEGQLGHAPQAQPHRLGAALRAGPGAAGLRRSRAGGRRPLARAGHLAQLGGARGAPRRLPVGLLRAAQGQGPRHRAGRAPRAGGGQPDRGVPRAGLQPVGAARAGVLGDDAGRGLPDRAA